MHAGCSGPLEYLHANYSIRGGGDCTSSVIGTRGLTMIVTGGGVNLVRLSPPGPGKPAVETVAGAFTVDPGDPTETSQVNSDGGSFVEEPLIWHAAWSSYTHKVPECQSCLGPRTIEGS